MVTVTDPGIYEAALKDHNLQAEESVFIDDILENVQGAVDCGLKGVHHTSLTETKNALKDLGVEV